ncbi:DUF5819 family protein [Phaeacidiphilus oryzae]|uniref:DUF5819 family protein n=1 Tax=Phaeacidiphilus oryzae TaxID=348818 RepID=UPI00068FD4D4|nr:DUF5819 family protein [Phaeacidiphilus oryzae]
MTTERTDPATRAEPPGRPRPAWVRGTLALAAVVLVGAVAYHLGTVFLSIAPGNPISERYQNGISDHVLPEFEQNWQLFAPDPLQADISVEARVQTLSPAGVRADSGWIDLTARDFARIRHNPAPSHVDQNQLRRAWDFYTSWHSTSEAPIGDRGGLSTEYLKRIALQRIGRDLGGRPIVQLQVRAVTVPLRGPAWVGVHASAGSATRTLPWWPVADADYQDLGVAAR